MPTMDVNFAETIEGDVAIFQRPAGYTLDIPEDVTFSSGDLKPDSFINLMENDNDNNNMVLTDGAKGSSIKLDVDNTKVRAPILSFTKLDQWDLDDVLKNLNKDRLSLLQRSSAKTLISQTHADNKQSHMVIMESLAALCENQAVSEPGKDVHSFRRNILLDESLDKVEAQLQLSDQERPTVYIDLRYPDSSLTSTRTSQSLSPKSKLPGKSSTEKEIARKHSLKKHSDSQTTSREGTDKRMLLQTIRAMNKNRTRNPDPCQPDDEKVKDEPLHSVESTCSIDSQDVFAPVDKQSSALESTTSKTIAPDKSIKEPKQQSNQTARHEKTTCHLEQDKETLEYLGKYRPTKSVNLKQPAAERTDVLYESEVSHQESISTLPAEIESKEHMLLTVRLSSPGMVEEVDAAHGQRKHLYSSATKAHIYNTLVAWFLSLAGPVSCHTEGDISADVPFWVAGVQQQTTKNGLALHVLAVAHYCFTPKQKDIDICTLFYNDVSRFLSETSLSAVADWLPQLKTPLDTQDFDLPIHLPSSCLNLFISTNSSKKLIDKTFGLSPGFYWHTVETHEAFIKEQNTTQELHTEVSVVVGSSAFFQHPVVTHSTLQLILDSGLDVCGLRLIYATQKANGESGKKPVNQRVDKPCQPVLALAVRGPHAHSVFKSLIDSIQPLLHKTKGITPDDLLLCKYHKPLIHCPQQTSEVHRELCFWFAGRLQARSAQNPNQVLNRLTPSSDRVRRSLLHLSRSSSLLCATTKADLLLVVSPVVPPHCYGQVLSVCERRGFSLMGLQRLRLQSNEASVLGLTRYQMTVFCRPATSPSDHLDLKSPSHCLVLLLRKENMLRHSVSLPSALMREFKAQKLLGCLNSTPDAVPISEQSSFLHTVPFSDSLFHTFVQHMWALPNPSSVIPSHQDCPSQSGMEQLVILTLHGKDMNQNLSFLHKVLTEGAKGAQHFWELLPVSNKFTKKCEQHAGFELLGLKWLPRLTQLQAQELSPYEVGEQQYCGSVINLMSSSALVCALRGTDVFSTMKKLLLLNNLAMLTVLMSPTPKLALRQASLFFFEHELIYDIQVFTACLLKPRVWNHNLAELICKLQQKGLKMVDLRVVNLDKLAASCLLGEHVPYLCSGSLALCLQGENAVKKVLDVLGQEDSSQWLPCCGPGSCQQAVKDIKELFPEGFCCSQTSTTKPEQTSSSDPFAAVEHKQRCTLKVTPEYLSVLATSGPNRESLIHRALGQTTCLLMPLNAPPHCQMPKNTKMLEQLLRFGCHLVAGRLSILDDEQLKNITEILTVPSEKMAPVFRAPCLIVALRGEKIATGLSQILKSIYKENPVLKKVGQMIVYPKSETEAQQLIRYLFEASAQDSGDPMEL